MAYTLIEAVNHVLVAGNETPVTSLTLDSSSAATLVSNMLDTHRRYVLGEGLQFNTRRSSFPQDINGKIAVAGNTLSVDGWQNNARNQYTIVNGLLYDVVKQSDVFTKGVDLAVVYDFPFKDIPIWVQYRIMTAVAVRFHVQFSPDQLHLQSLLQIERDALSRCNEKELVSLDIDMVNKSSLGHVATSGIFRRLGRM